MKAFILDPLWDTLADEDIKKKLDDAGIEVIVKKEIAPISKFTALFEGTEDRILCINPDYVGWKVTSEDYKNIPSLKAILPGVTSFDWIDASYADSNNIPICNIKGYSMQAVAEWAVTMMMNLARQVPRLMKDNFPLDFDKDFMKYRGQQIKGKTVGIIGLGRNGNAIAEICEGLGMDVIYWSRSEKQNNYRSVELDELLRAADFIFPTMANNNDTKTILTDEKLSLMKESASLISTVHGLFNEKMILEMVADNRLFGFGFEAEPESFNSYEGNVWAAPAYAWVTEESMRRSIVQWTDNMVAVSKGEFASRVN
jgi:phosphoglycerate dehydrogenase-like enzyme